MKANVHGVGQLEQGMVWGVGCMGGLGRYQRCLLLIGVNITDLLPLHVTI
jgi:hypothetical protein